MFLDHFIWLSISFLCHFKKVRPTHIFDPGIDSVCPLKLNIYSVTNPFTFREGDTLRNASCSCISPTFQVSSSKELRLYYLSEERRFTLIEKGTAQTDPHSFIHMGKQGEFSESFKIQPPPLNVDGNIVDVLVSETHSYLDEVYCFFFY